MKADESTILAIFERKICLEVPLFQRQYVWNQEKQWSHLWDDISHLFHLYIQNRNENSIHFLGAVVLDYKRTPTTHVEKRQIIDGQQRLITLQIFLAAFRDFCIEQGSNDLANECESFIINKGMMKNQEMEKFKVWPTFTDRSQFDDIITARSKTEIETRYPSYKRPYARKYEPRPRMVEAYLFFYEQISNYFLGDEQEILANNPEELPTKLESGFNVLKNALLVAVIDLDEKDDAQVIFESLNYLGEPLLPADLIRNYIFLRVARESKSQEDLYAKFWLKFDEPFWRKKEKQGRLLTPRIDLFMQFFIISYQATDIQIKYLYSEYKSWIEKSHQFDSVEEELAALAKQGEVFKRILDPDKEDILFSFIDFLKSFEITTTHPLILYLFNKGLVESDLLQAFAIIESYLLRRAVCNYTTKDYNHIFLNLIKYLQENGSSVENISKYLSELTGDSRKWPDDNLFNDSWKNQKSYNLTNSKLAYILKCLNKTFLSTKNERLSIEGNLTIEHILPQHWIENWPLQDGTKGMTNPELNVALLDDNRYIATKNRDDILQTMGNLTILTQALNSSVSNSPWHIKKPKLLEASLLPINQVLLSKVNVWDEEAIERRSIILFNKAISIWQGPSLN